MEQQFILLHKSNPAAWAFMPYALERIKKFAVKYQTDTNPDEIASLIMVHFVSDKPVLVAGVAYQPGDGVFAHVLACIDDITGNRFLTIMQMETDIPFSDREPVKRMFEELKVWGLQNGAEEARIVTSDKAHARMFERYYGFKQHRIVMRKSLLES